jgi:hypothetical protein
MTYLTAWPPAYQKSGNASGKRKTVAKPKAASVGSSVRLSLTHMYAREISNQDAAGREANEINEALLGRGSSFDRHYTDSPKEA